MVIGTAAWLTGDCDWPALKDVEDEEEHMDRLWGVSASSTLHSESSFSSMSSLLILTDFLQLVFRAEPLFNETGVVCSELGERLDTGLLAGS